MQCKNMHQRVDCALHVSWWELIFFAKDSSDWETLKALATANLARILYMCMQRVCQGDRTMRH